MVLFESLGTVSYFFPTLTLTLTLGLGVKVIENGGVTIFELFDVE